MRYLLLIILLLPNLISKGQDASIGMGLSYGSFFEKPGIKISGSIQSDDVAFEMSFTGYLREKVEKYSTELHASTWFIDGDALVYLFSPKDFFSVYGIIGMNFTAYKRDLVNASTYQFSRSFTQSGFGLNFGAGIDIKTKVVIPYIEAKHQSGHHPQWVLNAGVKYNLLH